MYVYLEAMQSSECLLKSVTGESPGTIRHCEASSYIR